MTLQDMLALMPQHKPEVVDPIKPCRHSDNGRLAVEPEAHTVNPRLWKCLHDNKPNATFSHDARDVSRLFGRRKKFAHLNHGIGKHALRVTGGGNRFCDLPNPKKPRELGRRNLPFLIPTLSCSVRNVRNLIRAARLEEACELCAEIIHSRRAHPPALYHLSNRVSLEYCCAGGNAGLRLIGDCKIICSLEGDKMIEREAKRLTQRLRHCRANALLSIDDLIDSFGMASKHKCQVSLAPASFFQFGR